MDKRGISPLIATILLVGFTVALGAVMITWGNAFVKDLQKATEETSLKTTTCSTDIPVNIRNACLEGNKVKILVENQGSLNATRFNIRVTGSNGAYSNLTSSGVNAFGIGSIDIALDPNVIGTLKQVEVFPVINFQSEEVSCVNVYDKEEDINGCPDQGLVAYYSFDDNTNDLSGNKNDGVNNGAVFVSGVSGKALNFDGTVNTYFIKNPFNSMPSTSITAEFWAKITGDFDGIISYASNSHPNDFIIYNEANMDLYIMGNFISSGVSFNDNLWHHIAASWQSGNGNVVIYKDGVQVYSGTLQQGVSITNGGSLVFAQEQDNIGDAFDPVQAMPGMLDEVKIYNYAKSY